MQSHKVVIVGNTKVGKTCIVDRLVSGAMNDEVSPTIGASFMTFQVHRPNGDVRLHLWDTAGQEKFMSITSTYYRNSSYAIVVFDLSDQNSFDDLPKWIHDLRENAPDSVQLFLVGNKKDLIHDRKITRDTAQRFADSNNFAFYREVSALTGEGVKELFYDIANIDSSIREHSAIKEKNGKGGSGQCC